MAKLLVIIIALCIATSLAQTTYPLVCSGLPNNTRLYAIRYIDQKGSGFNSYITYNFQRGTKSFSAYAASGGLPAATCTWLDRGIGSSEPANLRYDISSTVVGNTQFYISQVGDGITAIASNDVVRAFTSTYTGNLPTGGSARKTFNAYNNGNGYFIITGLSTTQV